jgi:hypothetical protein
MDVRERFRLDGYFSPFQPFNLYFVYQFGMFSLFSLYLKAFIVELLEFIYFFLSLCALTLIEYPMFWWVYRLDISEEKFIRYFWWCWNKLKVTIHLIFFMWLVKYKRNNSGSAIFLLGNNHWHCWNICCTFQDRTGDGVPMPAYFRFLALLAFKIFSDEQVNTL